MADRFVEFAARVGRVVDALPATRMGRHVAAQLVRSGTSPAPNYCEACAAESRRDFVHKLSVCLKELRESQCWLQLIGRANLLPLARIQAIEEECRQLSNIVAKSIVTAKANTERKIAPK